MNTDRVDIEEMDDDEREKAAREAGLLRDEDA